MFNDEFCICLGKLPQPTEPTYLWNCYFVSACCICNGLLLVCRIRVAYCVCSSLRSGELRCNIALLKFFCITLLYQLSTINVNKIKSKRCIVAFLRLMAMYQWLISLDLFRDRGYIPYRNQSIISLNLGLNMVRIRLCQDCQKFSS